MSENAGLIESCLAFVGIDKLTINELRLRVLHSEKKA
jgi:hypothetical protein